MTGAALEFAAVCNNLMQIKLSQPCPASGCSGLLIDRQKIRSARLDLGQIFFDPNDSFASWC
jgi:hypothetical protein